MTEFTWYQNGDWIPQSEFRLDPDDRGPKLGDQVVDVERTFGGKGFKLKEHIGRLYKSLAYVRIDPGLSPAAMLEITEEGIRRNWPLVAADSDLRITQLVTRGPGPARAWAAGPPNVYVKFGENNMAGWAHHYDEGVHGVITKIRSYDPDSIDPKVKHQSRINMALAELEANDADPGAWPILSDRDGNLTEGSGYNLFMVEGGALRTPTDRATLAGMSRDTVLELAETLEIPATEEDLQPYDLYTAEEAFFCSTPFAIFPVPQVDRRKIGDGNPGPITQRLLAAWSELVGVDIVEQARQQARRAAAPTR